MTSRTDCSTQTPTTSTLFSGQYLRNHWTLDIGVLGYIGIVRPKEHSPEVRSFPPGTPCISRPIPAFPALWLQKHADLRAHGFAHCLPPCDISLGSLTLPSPEADDFVELILLYLRHPTCTCCEAGWYVTPTTTFSSANAVFAGYIANGFHLDSPRRSKFAMLPAFMSSLNQLADFHETEGQLDVWSLTIKAFRLKYNIRSKVNAFFWDDWFDTTCVAQKVT